MANSNNSSKQCLLPSELTPKQLKSLSFVPGALTNFDEKEKLPPTARAQWAYVQLNPVDYLNRFTNELGLLGVSTAICFINKEPYEDTEKDLRTPITVNLIVDPDQIAEISTHLEGTNLSHQVLEENKGFTLPYLGSIQKTVDALALENFISYVFIKNSISREAYSTWISVPKSYLDASKSAQKAAKKAKKQQESQAQEPAEKASREAAPKEDFNYVIYDDTGETAPPVIPQGEDPKPTTVVVAQPQAEKKESAISKFGKRLASKKKKKKDHEPANPIAKLDAALFVFLALFNFYSSILLLNFLGTTIEAIGSIMTEAVTGAAFISLLFAILVIRPSFRIKSSRFWSLLSYVGFTAVAGYQIISSFNFPENATYLVPGALTVVFIMGAIISAFMRIDRLSARKAKKGQKEEEEVTPEEQLAEEIELIAEPELQDQTPVATAAKSIDLPAPARPKEKKKESKKIELKPSAKTAAPTPEEAATQEIQEPAQEETAQKSVKLPSQKNVPSTPITEEQKQAIRNRLSRRETLSTPSETAAEESAVAAAETTSEAQKPLSTAEIKARLAERLQKARETNSGLDDIGKPKETSEPEAEETVEAQDTPEAKETAAEATESGSERKSIQLRKPADRSQSKQRSNKLSLPNS